jgi:hypothetical protein
MTQAFTTVYTALVYGIFYSFFESFPLVYPVMYGFNLGESSLPFLAVFVGLIVSMPAYCGYYYLFVEKSAKRNGFGPPEDRLIPGLWVCFCLPIGLFIFGSSFPNESTLLRFGADCKIRVDLRSCHSLDCQHYRCLLCNCWVLHYHTVALSVPPIHVSQVCRLALRR